ncbi:MAG TPA: extracellular solute-binding protein, partial [Actinomycetota bacterium]
GLVQPLRHDSLPNLANVWPELQSPFYDVGSRYSVPYAVYSTGIGWRSDFVIDPGARDDPWGIFWDPDYRGRVFVLDDYRAGLQLALLRRGEDINTEDARLISEAAEDLYDMTQTTSVRWSLDDYTFLPEGRAWIHQAWSGDMVTAPYYGPGTPEETAETLGYWFPPDGRGEVNNDVLCVVAGCAHPVLAHRFLDYLLDQEVAVENFSWVGYQQPVTGLTHEVAAGVYPWLGTPNLASAYVTPAQLAGGYRQLELSVPADALWQQAWLQFRSHG